MEAEDQDIINNDLEFDECSVDEDTGKLVCDAGNKHFLKRQNTIRLCEPMVPPKIRQMAKFSEQYFNNAIQKLVTFVKEHPLYEVVDDPEREEETSILRQKMLELSYLLQTLLFNFRVNIKTPLLGEAVFVLSKIALRTKGMLEWKLRLLQNLIKNRREFYRYADLNLLTDWASETNLWESIFQYYEKKSTTRADSCVGNGIYSRFQFTLSSYLSIINKIFLPSIEDILNEIRTKGIRLIVKRTNAGTHEYSDMIQALIPVGDLLSEHLTQFAALSLNEVRSNHFLLLYVVQKLCFNQSFVLEKSWFERLRIAIHLTLTSNQILSTQSIQKSIIRRVAYIIISLIFGRGYTGEQFDDALLFFKSITDPYIESIHPKVSQDTPAGRVFGSIIATFGSAYFQKIDRVEDTERRNKIKTEVEELFLKVANFGIYQTGWVNFGRFLQSLVIENKEKYLDLFLIRIRDGLEQTKFHKFQLIQYLDLITGFVLESPKHCQNIFWMIPTLASRLRESSEWGEVLTITNVFSTIFEYFVDCENTPGAEHLANIKDDIDEAAIAYFKDLLNKGRDKFYSNYPYGQLFDLGPYVVDKCRKLFNEEFLKGNIEQQNISGILTCLGFIDIKETEKFVINWINKEVLSEKKEEQPLNELVFGDVLRSLGFTSNKYGLRSENTETLKKHMTITFSIANLRGEFSNEYLEKLCTLLVLCLESEKEEVYSTACDFISKLIDDSPYEQSVVCSKFALRNSIRNKEEIIKGFKYTFYEQDRKDRDALLWKTGLFSILKAIVDRLNKVDESLRSANHINAIEYYKQTLSSCSSANIEDLLKDKEIKKLFKLIKAVTPTLKKISLYSNALRSPRFVALLRNLRLQLCSYAEKGKLLEIVNYRLEIARFLMTDLQAVDFLIGNSQNPFNNVLENFNLYKCFKSWTVSNQTMISNRYSLNQFNIFHICGLGEESAFDTIIDEFPVLLEFSKQTNSMCEESQTPRFYVFGGQFYDYFIKECCMNRELYPFILSVLNLTIVRDLYKRFFSTFPQLITTKERSDFFDKMESIIAIETPHADEKETTINLTIEGTLNIIPEFVDTYEAIQRLGNFYKTISKCADKSKHWGTLKTCIYKLVLNFRPYRSTGSAASIVARVTAASLQPKIEVLELLFIIVELMQDHPNYEDNVTALKELFLGLFRLLRHSDVSKRIIVTVGLSFLEVIAEKAEGDTQEVVIDHNAFYDQESALPNATKIAKLVEFMKARLGLGNVSDEILKEFNDIPEFDESYFVKTASGNSLPFRARKYTSKYLLSSEFNENEILEISIIVKSALKLTLLDLNQEVQNVGGFNQMVAFKEITGLGINYVDPYWSNPSIDTHSIKGIVYSLFRCFGVSAFSMLKKLISELETETTDSENEIISLKRGVYGMSLGLALYYLPEVQFISIFDEFMEYFLSFCTLSKTNYHRPFLFEFSVTLRGPLSLRTSKLISERLLKLYEENISNRTARCLMLSLLSVLVQSSFFGIEEANLIKLLPEMKLDNLTEIADITRVLSFQQQILGSYCIGTTINPLLVKPNKVMSSLSCFDIKLSGELLENKLKKEWTEKLLENMEAFSKYEMTTRLGVTKDLLQSFFMGPFFSDLLPVVVKFLQIIFSLTSAENEALKQSVDAFTMGLKIGCSYMGFSIVESNKMLPFLKDIFEQAKNHSDSKSLYINISKVFMKGITSTEVIESLALFCRESNAKIEGDIASALKTVLQGLDDKSLAIFIDYLSKKLNSLEKM